MTTVNIEVSNDSDFYREFMYTTTELTPIDLTGTTMEMMLRRHATDETALMRLGLNTGEIVYTNDVAGKFTILIRQADLEQLGLGAYVHSLIMTRGSLKTEIWSGSFVNNAGPTR